MTAEFIYWTAMLIGLVGLGVLALIARHIRWRQERLNMMARKHLLDLQGDLRKIAAKGSRKGSRREATFIVSHITSLDEFE